MNNTEINESKMITHALKGEFLTRLKYYGGHSIAMLDDEKLDHIIDYLGRVRVQIAISRAKEE